MLFFGENIPLYDCQSIKLAPGVRVPRMGSRVPACGRRVVRAGFGSKFRKILINFQLILAHPQPPIWCVRGGKDV